jgi:hypothetical protein
MNLYVYCTFNKMYIFISLFTPITWDRFLKKRWLKPQDSNLESFNYESNIATLRPTLSSVVLCLNNNLNRTLVRHIAKLLGLYLKL